MSYDDANSEAATRFMAHRAEPLPFTTLHRLEVFNGIRLAVKRGDLLAGKAKIAIALVEKDLKEGVLFHEALSWTDLLRGAEALSAAHTEELGCRSLDILHVAAALEIGAKLFLSFDTAQRKLAKAAGLQVKP